MVVPPFGQRFPKPRKNSPFSRLISGIVIAVILLVFSVGIERLTGYDILGFFYTSDRPEPSGKAKTHSPASRERNLYGRFVSRVIDGDTLEIRDTDGVMVKVRLYGADAPETEKREHGGQPFGEEAFAALRNKVEGKNVDVEVVEIDRYGRAIAIVRLSGRGINMEMVSEGLAECYQEYLDGQRKEECAEAEAFAKQIKKGIWTLENYERPNDFRKRMRQGQW